MSDFYQDSLPLSVEVPFSGKKNDNVYREVGLLEFSRDGFSCPKCLSDSVSSKFHYTSHVSKVFVQHDKPCSSAVILLPDCFTDYFPEHLDIKCSRCGYMWMMESAP